MFHVGQAMLEKLPPVFTPGIGRWIVLSVPTEQARRQAQRGDGFSSRKSPVCAPSHCATLSLGSLPRTQLRKIKETINKRD